MFYKASPEGYIPAVAGVQRKTLVYGEKVLCAEFQLQKGYLLPKHAHPHEQAGYLVSGHIRLTIGSETYDVTPGDSWCVAGNVEHWVEILEDSVVIEVFSPVREDYLPG